MESIFSFISSVFWFTFWMAIILGGIALFGYNTLRALSEGIKEAWSNIGVATRKQVSLINQLIEVVKGYQDNEKFVMLKVSEDSTMASVQHMHQQTNLMMSQLNTLAQRFPELKADQHYSRLIDNMQSTESEVERQRERYNAAAKAYNVRRSSIPHVFYSKMLGFLAAPYLDFSSGAAEQDMGVLKTFASDDGDRLNSLLATAGSKALGIGRDVGAAAVGHGKKIVVAVQEKTKQIAVTEFHYLDGDRNPRGPITHDDLSHLFNQGLIAVDTPVMAVGEREWKTYGEVVGQSA